jgi:hypothetical protein
MKKKSGPGWSDPAEPVASAYGPDGQPMQAQT